MLVQHRSILFWIIQVSYLFLIAMTILFFQERLLSDTSYYFFKTLNQQQFHVEHQRYVLAIAELPVYLLSNMGAPLKVMAIVFSVWHVVYFYLIGFVIFKKYKSIYPWLLLLLLQLIGVVYGFVCPIFEQYYGTALAVLFYFILKEHSRLSIKSNILSLFLFAMIIMSHPFNAILAIFILALDYIEYRNIKKYIPYLLLIPLFILFKKMTASEYESGKMNWIFDLEHNKTYEMLFQKEHIIRRIQFLFSHYYEVLIGLVVILSYYIYSKSLLKFFVVASFFAGAMLLINFSYNIEELTRYHEQVYYLIVPIVFIPFVLDFYANLSNKMVKGGFTFLLLVVIVTRIWKQKELAEFYTAKQAMVEAWIQKGQFQQDSKFYIFKSSYPELQQMMDWDIPYYSLMMSSMKHYAKQVTIFPIEEKISEVNPIATDEYWFRAGEKEKISTLNKQYFQLGDTTRLYEELK